MKKKHILLLMLFMFSINAFSQVGINTKEPNQNSALHISEKMQSSDPDINNKIKGIIIPRLTEAERNKLTYSDAPANTIQRLTAADNSLMIFNTTENCYNFWNLADSEWKSMCGNTGNAVFTYSCSNVAVKGNYVKGTESDGTHYIIISGVNVTKPGAYTIKAISDPSNGYSFFANGTFTSTGAQTVKLYAQGSPVAAQTDTFTLSSSGSNTQPDCTVDVVVNSMVSSYSVNCGSVQVNGVYKKGTALTSSNTIKMNVNVGATGSYSFSTDTVSGIRFSASGMFNSTGTQSVTLVGSGTPTINEDIVVTITSNTVSGNSSCSAKVLITLPSLTYAIIGSSDYSWASTYRTQAVQSANNFGPNGKVKVEGLTRAWLATSASAAETQMNNSVKPDIILYFAYGAGATDNLSSQLANYVNKGGVLIYGNPDSQSTTQLLMNGIYGTNTLSVISLSDNSNSFLINTNNESSLINGSFGNLSGKYWADDNGGNVAISNIPSSAVQVASAHNLYQNASVSPDASIVWYDDAKNFVFFGDSVASAWDTQTSTTGWASIFNQSTSAPSSKLFANYFSNTANVFVYNAALELNSLAWAIKKAANSGINSH